MHADNNIHLTYFVSLGISILFNYKFFPSIHSPLYAPQIILLHGEVLHNIFTDREAGFLE